MVRLINANALIEVIKNIQSHMKEANQEPVPVDAREIFTLFIDMVEKQSTAYDVEAVMQQLQEKSFWMQFTFDEDGYCNDDSEEVILLDDAIEIIRNGDTTISECEWKYSEDEYYWKSSCKNLHMFMSGGPIENGYKVCPYCGKKIKVV